jgi:hypothetical protein
VVLRVVLGGSELLAMCGTDTGQQSHHSQPQDRDVALSRMHELKLAVGGAGEQGEAKMPAWGMEAEGSHNAGAREEE